MIGRQMSLTHTSHPCDKRAHSGAPDGVYISGHYTGSDYGRRRAVIGDRSCYVRRSAL